MRKRRQFVRPGLVDQIVEMQKTRMTVNEIAKKLDIKRDVVSDAISYGEATGRLTGKEVREASVSIQ